MADDVRRSVLNVRDLCVWSATAVEHTAASSAEPARQGGERQRMLSRFRS